MYVPTTLFRCSCVLIYWLMRNFRSLFIPRVIPSQNCPPTSALVPFWTHFCPPCSKPLTHPQSKICKTENFQPWLGQLKVNPTSRFFVPEKLQVIVIGIATRLRPGRSRCRIPVSEKDFSSRQVLQTGSRAHRAFYSIGTSVLSRQYGGRGLKLTIHLHLVMRLRMSKLHLYYPHMPSRHGQGNFTKTLQKPQRSEGDEVQEITTCRKQAHARFLKSILK